METQVQKFRRSYGILKKAMLVLMACCPKTGSALKNNAPIDLHVSYDLIYDRRVASVR